MINQYSNSTSFS